ncbi:MAG: hypothetical protein HKO59_01515 [Phycisphaerales bacterium]|nr:hypothetical protein [Phycisphaerae bacterium]NNF44423.1 hypothetical protein [Phycisphaerales bacterium]NNM24659.1 hypothetical protein [Phycisphaerales bacterium]
MHDSHGDKPGGRVLSVSPADAAEAVATPVEPARPPEVFVTPRVLDQTAFNELAGALRTLIDEANHAANRLTAATELAATPTPVQDQLRESLHLGARMLKAIQGQLDRAEDLTALLAAQEASLRAMPDAVRAEATTTLEESYARLEEAAEAARQRGEEKLARVDAGLTPVEERIGELLDRVETMTHTLETAEVTAAALARRVGRLEERG